MNPSATLTPTLQGSRVLVVDDVPKNLQVVGTMLRNAGYAVMPATSGARALEGIRVQLPDLILLDLMMPEIDGLEGSPLVKADPVTREIPIVFLTASNEMEHLVQGFEAGAVDYVTKPFNPPELLARVRTHIELKLARERLRELNEEKNEFMGIVAHDLRNPLGAIKGYAEMIAEDAGTFRSASPAELNNVRQGLEDCAGRIRNSAERMLEMVQNLLDANRIERGEIHLNLAPTELGHLVSSVIESQRPRAVAKQQSLHFQSDGSPITATADSNVMVQVLENLISNAVKYSPPGKTIVVRLKKEESNAICEVQDEGPGLSPEDRKKLFGKFARLSAKPTGGEHSTGLGLSIVKRMIEAMGGRVWCESEPGKGATFIVAVKLSE